MTPRGSHNMECVATITHSCLIQQTYLHVTNKHIHLKEKNESRSRFIPKKKKKKKKKKMSIENVYKFLDFDIRKKDLPLMGPILGNVMLPTTYSYSGLKQEAYITKKHNHLKK